MLRIPKWYKQWSADNPTKLYGPGIVVGTIGFAVIVAVSAVSSPTLQTTDFQTGPRGIGMAVSKFVKDNPQDDPYAAQYVAYERVEVPVGTPTAAEAYGDSVVAFGDMDQANFDQLTKAMSEWTGADIVLYDNGEVDANMLEVTQNCIELTQYLNTDWDGHNLASDGRGVNCYTCHRGEPIPPQSWFKAGAVNASATGWAAIQNRVMLDNKYTQSEFTSLPVDAVEKFLLDGESIKVHDLESRVNTLPGDPTWQNAERTFSLMNHQSNSLDVGCVYCHNTRAFYDGTQVTPQWSSTITAQQMLSNINQYYLEPRAELLPASSLGDEGDAGKANCATCHMGVVSPLNGRNMVAEWPELAAPLE
uniref:Photosynthetic reaction center cytochrome c subunit n=1 Tax=Rhodovulum robiginosum TaxID=68292 RepID=Q8GR75_9RHOB|nr:cytochrome subunit bound to reaction center [Rhodovulum robiginosum]